MSQWDNAPLYTREDSGKGLLIQRQEREQKKAARYSEVKKAGIKVLTLINENRSLFDIDLDNEDETKAWEVYLRYIDRIITDSLLQAVASSLGFLLDETDVEKQPEPLFATQLELNQPKLVFEPSLEKEIVNNFYDTAISLVDDIMGMAGLIPRIFKAGANYTETVSKHPELKRLRGIYISRLEKVIGQAKEEAEKYLDYSHLWTESRKEQLNFFLEFSRQVGWGRFKISNRFQNLVFKLTEDEIKALKEKPDFVKKKPPSLEDFRAQIEHYEQLYEEVTLLPPTRVFQHWFRVDITPFKTTLLTNIRKWGYVFKKHLLDHLVDDLAELNNFVEVADEGLMCQLREGDYPGLIKVMEFLRLIKERQRKTDSMFAPLKEIVVMLGEYSVTIPEVTMIQLQELPSKWINTKRLSCVARQNVGSLSITEIDKLRERIAEFERHQRGFRHLYSQKGFFSFDCKAPYTQLERANQELEQMEEKVKKLQSEADLFEVPVPDFSLTAKCRKENKNMKLVWDYIQLVSTTIDEWKKTLWHEIDVENMDMECKKYSKDLRGFDKDTRELSAFLGLESMVKNMLTSLRAVEKLQSSAIQDRHWDQLVRATKVQFDMNSETSLADMLNLNLHKYEEEVSNIVDKAVKELAMEKMISDLAVTWKDMNFEVDIHKRTGERKYSLHTN